jgi:hypothetical protein
VNEEGFKKWLQARDLAQNSISTRMAAVRGIENVLPELGVLQDDLDAAYEHDSLESARAALQKLKVDAEHGGENYRVLLPDSDSPVSRLENYIAWLGNYRSFKDGITDSGRTADRIRQYVLDNYIDPARERGDPSASIKVRDVHDALSLVQNWANVSQALAGPKFQALANLPAPSREGAEASPATVFTFDLRSSNFSMETVERELVRRFGTPITSAKKMVAYRLLDGREIALDRDRPPAQLWVEATESVPDTFNPQTYDREKGRHSGLPSRLSHSPPSGQESRQVAVVRVASMSELHNLLDWYSKSSSKLNRDRLEQYKRAFLARYSDFEPAGFATKAGGYFAEERAYKDVLIERAQDALTSMAHQDDAAVGGRFLDILTGQVGAPSNLLGWRTDAHIKTIRAQHPGELEREAGRLVRAEDVNAAIPAFVDRTWPMLQEGQPSKPYSVSRNLSTMLAALAHPAKAYGINSDPIARTARELTGDQILSWKNPLTPQEYAGVLELAEAIRAVMVSAWGWQPRDLWDVQGFVWAVNRRDSLQLDNESEELGLMNLAPSPTNLILYGPPGTGKTFATAREAVTLCNGAAPERREDLMEEYARLAASGRIEFVTFHQSYSYEEFVEGLRPVQGDEGSVGFQLLPEMGAFRRIARRAETSTGTGTSDFKIGDRRVFKMSIGQAADPDDAYLFEEALNGGYTLLGFGDIDWTDPRFEDREAIIEAYKKLESGKGKPEPTAVSGRVQCPYIFRNWMREGDLVIVSKGNSLFRAIGVVTGGYQYVPRESRIYSHRRAVDWLWRDRDGVPVEEIYSKGFTQKSIYLLTHTDLNIPALERYIASQQASADGAPEPFVLIIDEINRANISKVFGELITLLEADKRVGAQNELKVRLPYSRDMFGVPANLHVIGTMNTADRSIALLDTALRRRFQFRELMPDPDVLAEASEASGVNLVKLLTSFNERIEYLFDREHQIGHAYFIGCQSKSDIDDVMRHKIIPLLAEYFYEDWTKVAAVLGDANGAGQFLERIVLKPPAGFDADDGSEPRYRWSIKVPFGDARYEAFQ